jgi:hypothetical protein
LQNKLEVNVTKFYRYNIRNGFCVLEIRPDKETPNKFVLFGDGEALKKYDSPKDAAQDVFLGKTGYLVWDQLKGGPDNPVGLDEWELLDE